MVQETAVIMKYSAEGRIKIKSIEGSNRLMYSEIKMRSLSIRRISLCVKE